MTQELSQNLTLLKLELDLEVFVQQEFKLVLVILSAVIECADAMDLVH